MDITITPVKVIINNEEITLNVKSNIPFSRQRELARICAQAVVTDDGVYEPWFREIHHAFIVLFEYAGFTLPSNWTDDDVMEFVKTDDYLNIVNATDTKEVCHVYEMAEELIEYRKQTCRRNGFIEAIDNIKSLFAVVNQTYQESPAMAELLVEGMLKKIFGTANGANEIDDSIEFNMDADEEAVEETVEDNVEAEVFVTEDEVKGDANL